MNRSAVKEVIVVFKTHLDIGFTGYAADVLDTYCKSFIPAAVDLAFQVNTPNQKKFVWTVGSYLIMLLPPMPNGSGKLSGWAACAGMVSPAPPTPN